MAVYAFINPKFTFGGVDLSDHVRKATLKTTADELDSTAAGATAHTRLGGLLDGQLDIEFNQDFAAAKVDATIWPQIGLTPAFTLKRDNSANSATNPEYQGNVFVKEYTPLDGAIGSLGTTAASWPTSGPVVRAIV